MNRDEILLAASIMKSAADKEMISYRRRGSEEWHRGDPRTIRWNWGINEYKDGASFPAPPPGDAWNNPMNLTPEEFGVEEGWRPLLASEIQARGSGEWMQYMSNDSERRWRSGHFGLYPNDQFRTQRPMPVSTPLAGSTARPEEFPVSGAAPGGLAQNLGPAVRYNYGDGTWRATPIARETDPFHNPANLTLEQLGEGWRFLRVSERARVPGDADFWYENREWITSSTQGLPMSSYDQARTTYRTRTPDPALAQAFQQSLVQADETAQLNREIISQYVDSLPPYAMGGTTGTQGSVGPVGVTETLVPPGPHNWGAVSSALFDDPWDDTWESRESGVSEEEDDVPMLDEEPEGVEDVPQPPH